MTLQSGSKLAAYEIVAPLGAGGMGEVYRARDLKLKRDVAIKILPDEFSRDPDRLSRFQREAETLAALNHPHIAAIHELGEAGESRFLVLELVEGETLAERLARGPLPPAEALVIAKQLCDALEAAHEKGVIHRDLKPANIKVTPGGQLKVLDFGLAKALMEESASVATSNSPTLSQAATQAGLILGTAQYMSPEQAKGKSADRRADIWAFGVVLYEMLTAKVMYSGETVSETLAHVILKEPDWTLLPPDVPARLAQLLRRCLIKDPRSRLQSIGDARIEIEDILRTPADSTVVEGAKRTPAPIGLTIAVAAFALLSLVLAVMPFFQTRITPPEMRLQIVTPPTGSPLQFALSPDGRYLAIVAGIDGPDRLWLRPLDKTDAQPMTGTEGALYPFWSADSRSIGFFASGKLYRIDLVGGLPQALADAPAGRGGTWNSDGTIVFNPSGPTGLFRVSASGGQPAEVTRLQSSRQTSHRFPEFLPDGRHFVFHAQGIPEASGIYLGTLDGGEPKRLIANDSTGKYLNPGRLLYVRQGSLLAHALNVERGALTGDPERLADGVGTDPALNSAGFSVTTDGRIAYRAGGAGRRRLAWFDRTGKALSSVSDADESSPLGPELSPDERRLALDRTIQGNRDVFLFDLLRGGFTRFTFEPVIDGFPIWSPDGSRIVFESTRKGTFDLWIKPTGGTLAEEQLLESPNNEWPLDWSRDGKFLLYYESDPKTGSDLKALAMTGSERKIVVVANSTFLERYGQFSGDGRWVAYDTNESGRFEVMVQPFPEATGKWQISTNGGAHPRWRADGKELYFVAPDGKLMAASVDATNSTFEARTPIALFNAGMAAGDAAGYRPQYAVTRDGRFLINHPAEEATASPITILLNWASEPKK